MRLIPSQIRAALQHERRSLLDFEGQIRHGIVFEPFILSSTSTDFQTIFHKDD